MKVNKLRTLIPGEVLKLINKRTMPWSWALYIYNQHKPTQAKPSSWRPFTMFPKLEQIKPTSTHSLPPNKKQNRPSPRETSIPTIHFQGVNLGFSGRGNHLKRGIFANPKHIFHCHDCHVSFHFQPASSNGLVYPPSFLPSFPSSHQK